MSLLNIDGPELTDGMMIVAAFQNCDRKSARPGFHNFREYLKRNKQCHELGKHQPLKNKYAYVGFSKDNERNCSLIGPAVDGKFPGATLTWLDGSWEFEYRVFPTQSWDNSERTRAYHDLFKIPVSLYNDLINQCYNVKV